MSRTPVAITNCAMIPVAASRLAVGGYMLCTLIMHAMPIYIPDHYMPTKSAGPPGAPGCVASLCVVL